MRTRITLFAALTLVAGNPADAQARQDNPEMTAMFAADQAIRGEPGPTDADQMIAEDKQRWSRTRALLDAGALATGADFYHAAYIFQHGETADSFLLAHSCAMAAMKLGHPNAEWIAAATLDRYLQQIGQPQVFGTQYIFRHDTGMTRGAYNAELLPDQIRSLHNVPTLSEQEARARELADKVKHRVGK